MSRYQISHITHLFFFSERKPNLVILVDMRMVCNVYVLCRVRMRVFMVRCMCICWGGGWMCVCSHKELLSIFTDSVLSWRSQQDTHPQGCKVLAMIPEFPSSWLFWFHAVAPLSSHQLRYLSPGAIFKAQCKSANDLLLSLWFYPFQLPLSTLVSLLPIVLLPTNQCFLLNPPPQILSSFLSV